MPYALMYSSLAAFPLDEREVDTLLGQSRQRNAANGITGVLIYIRLDYERAAFLQVLEGAEPAVEETYRRIERDELHNTVNVLDRAVVAAARFRHWTMKFVPIDEDSLRAASATGPTDADTGALLRDRTAMDAVLSRHG